MTSIRADVEKYIKKISKYYNIVIKRMVVCYT